MVGQKILKKSSPVWGKTASVRVVDVYTSETTQSGEFQASLVNPVTQDASTLPDDFDWALEVGFLPGVTDNIGHTATELLSLSCHSERSAKREVEESRQHQAQNQPDPSTAGVRPSAQDDNTIYSAKLYLISGDLDKADVETLAGEISNSLIQRASIQKPRRF